MRNRRWTAAGAALVTGAALAGAIALGGSSAGASTPLARAELRTSAGEVVGEVVFKGQGSHVDRASIRITAPAGAPGLGAYHGLHVHTTGACAAPAFTSAGGHWNPGGSGHGHHAGDLPSVLVAADGTASMEFETPRFSVDELFDADGSAVVLHAGSDNFANVPAGYAADAAVRDATSKTGDAGGRYACGVVTR